MITIRTLSWALGLTLLLGVGVASSPHWTQDPTRLDLAHRLAAPAVGHWLGTDELGRDVAAQIMAGARVSLAIALAASLLSAAAGALIGLAAGWRGGVWDSALMRLTDGVMALPLLPLLIVLAAVDPTHFGITTATAQSEAFAIVRLIVIIALVGWTSVARLVRAQTLSVKSRDHVRAAIALGATPLRIVAVHILPHVAQPVVVATTSNIATVILMESALSFLGLGVRPPVTSWGNMLSGAMDMVWSAPLLALWPGLAIFAAVLWFSLLGDGLNERLIARR
jgi:peptide/nickel transport system permease protein